MTFYEKLETNKPVSRHRIATQMVSHPIRSEKQYVTWFGLILMVSLKSLNQSDPDKFRFYWIR